MNRPATLFLTHIILALCSFAYFSTPAHAQESTTGMADPNATGLQQITVRTSDMATTTTATVYWSGELQDAQQVLTGDGEAILPGAADVVDLIVVLESEAVASYQRTLAKGGKLTLEEQAVLVTAQQRRIGTEQRELLDTLKAERIIQATRGQYTYLVNAVALSAEFGRIDEIAQLPGVARVAFDYQAQIQLADSVPLIGANSVWAQQDSQGQALRGQGIRIAIIDSGIDYTHPDLGGCFGSDDNNEPCRVIDGYDFVNDDADPMDDNNHGTHVAGIAAANGTLQGVAPEATLLAYKVCNQYGSCANSAILAALERAADPDQNPLTDDAVDVVNMSLGGPGSPDDPLAQAANQAVAEGIIVVAAAGNSGSYRSVGSPGVAADVVTVGASTKNDTMASFSSKGWAGDYQIKPDVVAPGQAINAPVVNNSYQALNGTSMASPHVAGAAALLKQAHPNWTPDQIKLSLMNSALDLGVDPFAQGVGRIRLTEALDPTLFAAPGALSFGLIDPTVNSWSKSLPLTLTNPTNGAQTVQLVVGNLPNGLTVSLGQSTVTVAGGQSAVVNVTVTVDNSVLPFPQNDGFVYHGAIAITHNSTTYRVPLSVVKAAIIEVQATGGEWPVYLRKGDDSQFINVADQSSVLVPVTPGSYDLIAGYGYVDGYPTTKRFVFHEGIQVTQQSTQVAVVLQPGDAGHQLVTTFHNFDGQTETLGERTVQFFRHKSSGWWAMIKGYWYSSET